MTLSDTWDAYNADDFITSLELSAQSLVDNGGIDHLHIAGLSLVNMRRYDEGLALLNAAITLRPQSPHIYGNAALVAEQNGMIDQQAYFAEMGLRDFPDNASLLMIKANSLVMRMQFDEAIPYYHQILEHHPTHCQSMINLGNICRACDDFTNAAKWFDKVETIDPSFRDLKFARATMYTQMGEDEKAIQVLEPIANDDDAQFLLALLYLARGDYEGGFQLYRNRGASVWSKADQISLPLNWFDHWLEATDKTLAVIPEGGLGDLIQFIRYIPQLAAVARSITMFVHPSMGRLLQQQLPANVFIRDRKTYIATEYDYTTTIAEMPFHFRTTLETIPNKIPYLSVSEEAIERRRLPATDKIRVGLCWAGGERSNLNSRSYDTRRSFDLMTLAPLGKIPNIEFVSLQLGQRADQERADLPLTRVLNDSFDMLDTAAIIAQLDLVISVDTSIVHLAAAIGKPTWVLSRYDCCWRWLKNRPDSPWYPGVVRVFGQKSYNDWSVPIAEVTQALKQFSSDRINYHGNVAT